MNYPPSMIYLKFRSVKENGHDFMLWIPLFIIVPIVLLILLAIFLIVLPFLLISLIFTWNMWWWRYLWHGVPAIFQTLHSLKGTNVDLDDSRQKIYIKIR